MKVISFALFKDCPDYLFNYYRRGVYFNLRMAKLLFPDWKCHLTVHESIYNQYYMFFLDLNDLIPFDLKLIRSDEVKRCEAMLWRLDTLFENPYIDRVICRDLDSILTYRDAKSVERWIESGHTAHGMNDNPAHGGMKLMGGMCGFTSALRDKLSITQWDQIKAVKNLSGHGSDQDLLNSVILPLVEDSIYFDRTPQVYPYSGLSESDLVCRHIGSAGVVEMELIRFFYRHDPDNKKFSKFENTNKHLMYWRK